MRSPLNYMLALLGISCPLFTLRVCAEDIAYTWDEALKVKDYEWKSPDVEAEFVQWVDSEGIDPNKAWLASFQVGAAQDYAEAFCKAERTAKGLRCSWSDYQWLVNYMLLPYDKSFSHGHLEGSATEKAVHEQLPSVKACSEFNGVPTAIQFMNLVAASKPVIFKGAVRNWPAVKSWSTAGLAERLPNVTWSVAVSHNGEFDSVEPIQVWLPPLDDKNQLHEVESEVDPSGEVIIETEAKSDFRAHYALARPAKVELSTKQLFQALHRKPASQSQCLEEDHSNTSAKEWDCAVPDVSNEPYVYVEYAELAQIKADIAKAKLDPFESFFKDVGPAFDRKSKLKTEAGMSDLRFADFLVPSTRLLWLGAGGTVGNLHFDRKENLMAVVRGAKVFKLFDPLQSSILYHGTPLEHSQYNATVLDIGNNFSIAVNRILLNRTRLKSLPASETAKMALNISSYSPINLRRPDLKSFPDFSKASSVTCRAEAGDLLFVPSRWWHEVVSEPDEDGKTAAINLWYKPWYHKLKYDDKEKVLIRNEHYSHLHGERRSAYPCPDDEATVCWIDPAKVPLEKKMHIYGTERSPLDKQNVQSAGPSEQSAWL